MIYVDDIIIACHNEEQYVGLMRDLNRHFTVTSLYNIEHFLGIKVERIGKFFILNQNTYI